MYAENNMCADAREKMYKYSVVLVLYIAMTFKVRIFFYLNVKVNPIFYPNHLLIPMILELLKDSQSGFFEKYVVVVVVPVSWSAYF